MRSRRLVKYAIVLVGFILALLALGVNLDRVTVLGGAIGMGVGFGLQNIVNNFVSGLIVLFERPVRVGDAVQIGDVQGEVRRIGIRSTTVRAWEGAEVIVPNSQLVAEQRHELDARRISGDGSTFQVNVAYGSASGQGAAGADRGGPGPSRRQRDPPRWRCSWASATARSSSSCWAWTARLDRHGAVKSELGIAVYAALREAGFTIPFPQQEIRISQAPPPAP